MYMYMYMYDDNLQYTSNRPDINFIAMSLFSQYLRSNIVRSTTQSTVKKWKIIIIIKP